MWNGFNMSSHDVMGSGQHDKEVCRKRFGIIQVTEEDLEDLENYESKLKQA